MTERYYNHEQCSGLMLNTMTVRNLAGTQARGKEVMSNTARIGVMDDRVK